ncbi:MAG: LysR substrate-binding domain-containing protein [Candidatus Sedimenticola sp. 20ELBAFRAG]
MNLPTIRQLQYLVAVVELRHFGQAAERCFVTQSTLSAGIQELESLLGASLIERSKRKVLPTPLGLEIADKALQLLGLAGEISEMARHQGESMTGTLRLGVIPTIGPFLLPRVLPGIRRAFPGLELKLVEDQSPRLLQRLERGTLDTAILAFPYPTGELERRIFWKENFLVALPCDHSLAKRDQLATCDLPNEELLLLEEGHCLTDHALTACHLEGLKSRAAFEGTSLYTLLQMVAGGQGITFLPQMAATSELLPPDEIKLVPLSEPGPHRQIGLVWRKTFFRKNDLQILSETMENLLGKN